MAETGHEEIARLRREIGERQMRLQFLVAGDPMKSVGFPDSSTTQSMVFSDPAPGASKPAVPTGKCFSYPD